SAELYTAVDGQAWWNGAALGRLGDCPPAGDPFVAVHSKAHRRHQLRGVGKLRSLGAVGGVFEFLDGGPVPLGTLLDGRRASGDVLAGTPAAIAELRTQLRA